MLVRKQLILLGILGAVTISINANARRVKYPKIYPFKPFSVEEINKSIKNISEDENAIVNFNDIISQNLSRAKTKTKPWTSTYWPLNRGLIADPYSTTFIGYYVDKGTFSWRKNYRVFKARQRGILKNIDSYTEGALNMLAPAEKYDLLLGDKSFGLTNKLWDYMNKWGGQKEYGFLSSFSLIGEDALEIAKNMVTFGWYESVDAAFSDAYQLRGSLAVDEALRLVKSGQFDTVEDAMPMAIQNAIADSQNYVKERKNQMMAFWEGICHGWATAAGIIARPRNTIQFQLPDGRNMKFYPTDIKGLVSLLWANSLIQDNKVIDEQSGENVGGGVISEGLRCNLKSVKKDLWGRLYDHKPDPFSGDHKPRCSGVHPAVWHLGLVNIIGKQGRSFIVERKVGEEVDNHPMHSYSMRYFNPRTGRNAKNINRAIIPVGGKDQFKQFRNPNTKYIVGVETKMVYLDWARPQRFLKDHEGMDKTVTKKMFYDLELDENYNIIGGQWRAIKKGEMHRGNSDRLNHNQPDFFWVVTKNWKPFFKELEMEDKWEDTSKAPPASWLEVAKNAHDFKYMQKYSFSTGQKCNVYHRRTGQKKEVSCEYEVPKPQPLINVVMKMVELSQ